MSKRFEDKVIVVTGAAKGIGEAYAKALGAEGAAVVVADLNDDSGERVAKEIEAAGGRALYVHTDVSSAESAAARASSRDRAPRKRFARRARRRPRWRSRLWSGGAPSSRALAERRTNGTEFPSPRSTKRRSRPREASMTHARAPRRRARWLRSPPQRRPALRTSIFVQSTPVPYKQSRAALPKVRRVACAPPCSR